MKHIVFYSGGIGSWMTAKRVVEKHGKENVILLFTDTLIEDEDLYRFIDETVAEMGVEYVYQADGRTPWEVFKDVRWLGNSRLAQCSHLLKQKPAEKWIKDNFKPDECTLYLGIDWSEEHRTKAPTKNWAPYKVEFPMCEQPYLYKQDMLDELKKTEIEVPKLYKLNFSHNNCGGRCVRGGQGHWVHLLETMPERFHEVEGFEKEMQNFLGKDVTILSESKTRKIWVEEEKINYDDLSEEEKFDHPDYGPGDIITIPAHYIKKSIKTNLPLTTLEQRYEAGKKEQIDMFDIGGCGCFVQDDNDKTI